MATTPNEYKLTGKLQVVFDGREPMELGEIEIPVRLDFRKPPRPGAAYRGAPLGSFEGVFPRAGSDDVGHVES